MEKKHGHTFILALLIFDTSTFIYPFANKKKIFRKIGILEVQSKAKLFDKKIVYRLILIYTDN